MAKSTSFESLKDIGTCELLKEYLDIINQINNLLNDREVINNNLKKSNLKFMKKLDLKEAQSSNKRNLNLLQGKAKDIENILKKLDINNIPMLNLEIENSKGHAK